MNDNLLDNLIKNCISSVKPVFESWYNNSDKNDKSYIFSGDLCAIRWY